MKVVIACDKYKGSLSAYQVCSIIGDAVLEVNKEAEVIISPMADGGEGTVDTLVESFNGRYIDMVVMGPLGEEVKTRFGIIEKEKGKKIAVIEMSSASGLWLVPEDKRNPLLTTTYGTGEMIKKALDQGCEEIIIGIGGSATNDAGMGMAQALGAEFFDREGNVLGLGGRQLGLVAGINMSGMDERITRVKILAACDVDNPFYGPDGAAFVYGPQKGANRDMVDILDRGLRNISGIIKNDLGKDVSFLKGAGAAGGLGGGLTAFLGASLKPGNEIISEATGLDSKIKGADLVITGEGSMDRQTFYGKSSFGVAKVAGKYGIPVITINGSVRIDYNEVEEYKQSMFAGNFAIINEPMLLESAIKNGRKLLHDASKEIIKFYFNISGR